jgi:hypothetical protein
MPATFQAPPGAAAPLCPHPPPAPGAFTPSSKMRTKCGQNPACDIFSSSTSTTCNFSTSKCPHFPPSLTLNPNPNLIGKYLAPRPIPLLQLDPASALFVPLFPIPPVTPISPPVGKSVANTVQIRTKPDDFQLLKKPATSYQPLTTTPRSGVRFSTALDPRLSSLDPVCPPNGVHHWAIAPSNGAGYASV